jgi:alkylation response protein AidB-like acyl-CoA dehydrogenase
VVVSRAHSEFVVSQFEEFVRLEGAELPLPGAGATWSRFTSLAHLASLDLSLGRLCEGHGDALAILDEAEMKPFEVGASYGVWASRGSRAKTTAERTHGRWQLSGHKEFCSGSGTLDRALVTAETLEGYLLFDVSVEENVVSVDEGSWPAVGMADSNSKTLEFAGPALRDDQVVGVADFYTRRPGFWFGAAGVAACWYGGAVGLVNDLADSLGSEGSEHVMADLGRAVTALESMRYVLKSVAEAIDEDPLDASRRAQFRALVARQMVHDGATEVLARVAAAGGARPLCHNEAQSRRAADLYVYLAQHHGSADADALGRLMMGSRS